MQQAFDAAYATTLARDEQGKSSSFGKDKTAALVVGPKMEERLARGETREAKQEGTEELWRPPCVDLVELRAGSYRPGIPRRNEELQD